MKRTALIALSVTAGLLPTAPAFADGGAALPQMDFSTYPSQMFWLAVSFILVYVAMATIALPRVQGVLDSRRAQKDDHLAQVEQLNEEAEKVKKAYEKSLAEAHKKAAAALALAARDTDAKVAQEQSAFSEKARVRLAETERNIAKAKTEALDSMTEIATDIASDIMQKVANMNIDETDTQHAVKAIMKGGKA